MAKEFAAFPLNLVCFPGETQNLHIFEPRYRSLIQDCRDRGISFILVPFIDGKSFHLGTEMHLDHIEKEYPDGKFDVRVKAVGLVKISRLTQRMGDKTYPGVKATPLSWNMETDYEKCEILMGLIKELYATLNISNTKVPEAHDLRVHQVVHKLGLSISEELELISLANEVERLDYLIKHLTSFIPTIKRAEKLKVMAALNGHFKNINPKHLY